MQFLALWFEALACVHDSKDRKFTIDAVFESYYKTMVEVM
jgi:hypothetical protein